MTGRIRQLLVLAALVAGAAGARSVPADRVFAQGQQGADLILTNGKIITVDGRFSIAQAVAIRGERIQAVGTNQEITRLAGPTTRRIDLRGRSVVPGLIDNHAHYMEEGVLWTFELRLDGIESRKQALEMIRAKAASLRQGEWVYTLGGWSPDQFADDKRPFAREELDKVAPNHPVLLQFTRAETYLNSRAVETLGLARRSDPWIRRDAGGQPTGVLDAGGANFGPATGISEAIPRPTISQVEVNSLAMIRELNSAGLTASGGTCPDEFVPIFQRLAREGRLNKRFLCLVAVATGNNADAVTKNLPGIGELKLFQGDNWVDHFAYGEGLYGPAGDSMVAPRATQRPEDFQQWGRIAREIARAGLPLHSHTTLEGTFDGFLDQIEQINKEIPVRNLRWVLIHDEQVGARHLERMRSMGVTAGIQPRATIMGGIYHRAHGDRAFSMPDFRLIQDSGIVWGLGTDAFEVNQYRPFTTLGFAVTGRMVGGAVVNRRTVTREEALIAHTRGSAYQILQENNLGSIQTGRLADMVVIDRDYLTVPMDQIKDIRSVMTIVGGRVAYDAAAPGGTAATR